MKDEKDPEDRFWGMVQGANELDSKIILLIISIPFLMGLGTFLVGWNAFDLVLATNALLSGLVLLTSLVVVLILCKRSISNNS